MTPMDWRFITGVEFGGEPVPCMANITPTAVRSLLGVPVGALKGRTVRSGPLSVDAVSGLLSEPMPDDVRIRNRILRRLFLIIIRGCFIADNSSTVSFALVSATRDVDRIGEYDWGSYTFAYFLRGMRLRSQGLTEAWLGFYPFLLVSISLVFFFLQIKSVY